MTTSRKRRASSSTESDPHTSRIGRPSDALAKFDKVRLEAMLDVAPTLDMVAAAFGISISTVRRGIERDYGMDETFERLAAQRSGRIALALRLRVLRGAMSGDRTLLIFASKAFAGLSDRIEVRKDAAQHADDQKAAAVATAATTQAAAVDAQRLALIIAALEK